MTNPTRADMLAREDLEAKFQKICPRSHSCDLSLGMTIRVGKGASFPMHDYN